MLNLTNVLGSRSDWTVQAPNRDRSTATGFLITDTLTCSVWAGLDAAPLLTLAVAWADLVTPGDRGGYALGRVAITLTAAQSASLESLGDYRVQVWVTRGSDTGCIIDAALRVNPSYGSGSTAIVPYNLYRDVLDIAPWVAEIKDSDASQEGFYRQRLMARQWLDAAILSNDRGACVGQFGILSYLAFSFGNGGGRRPLGPSPSMVTYLAADTLILRPRIVQACAYKTAAIIGMGYLGTGGKYTGLACYCSDEAERLIVGQVAELDVDGDGIGELFVSLSASNTLFT